MKKSLIALAVLAAAGAASAQSSVTLYGRMDLGAASVKKSETDNTGFNETTKTTDLAGNQNMNTTSRLGVKGVEDLGGGLKAFFNYEFAIQPDVATSVGNTRLANVGVQGGFGAVVIGTYLNSLDTVRGYSATAFNLPGGDFFAKQANGDYASRTYSLGPNGNAAATSTQAQTAWAAGSYTANQNATGLDGRSQNSLAYRAEFSGVRVGLGVTSSSTKNTSGTTSVTPSKTTGYMLGLGYTMGALSADLAYGYAKAGSNVRVDANNDGLLNTTDGLADAAATNAHAKAKISDIALALSYDLGFAKPYIAYEQAKRDTTGYNLAQTASGLTTTQKSRGYELGSTFTFGAFRPYVAINSGKQTYSGTNWTDKTTGWQVGTRYDLSKRTYLQAAYGSEKTKGTSGTFEAIGKASGFGMGVVHQF